MTALSDTRLVNYFGRIDSGDPVLKPVLLAKGDTLLALYGMGHVRDEYLCRMLDDNEVRMEVLDHKDQPIVSVLALHQNRVGRGRSAYVPEAKLPPSIDIVLWGHEHDTRMEPAPSLASHSQRIIQVRLGVGDSGRVRVRVERCQA